LRLTRLCDAIEAGIAALTTIRDQTRADAAWADAAREKRGVTITPSMLTTFVAEARRRMRIEAGGYRREHLRGLAQRGEVGPSKVRIIASKTEPLRTLSAAGRGKAAAFSVRRPIPKWRALVDSNHRPTA